MSPELAATLNKSAKALEAQGGSKEIPEYFAVGDDFPAVDASWGQAVIADAEGSPVAAQQTVSIKDEDLLADISKRFGIELKSIDDMKGFFEKKEPPKKAAAEAEMTAEEKIAAEQQKSIEIMQAFYETGGTKEQYETIQRILATDGGELSKREILSELKSEGFTDEEAVEIYKNRYYIAGEGEEDLYTETQRKLGEKKLKAREERIKNEAISPLKKAEELIESRKKINQQWKGWTESVDETIKGFNKNIEIPVLNDKGEEVGKVPYILDDKTAESIKADLQNPNTVRELLYNTDNKKGATQLAELLMWSKIGKQLASKAYQTGASNAHAEWEKKFPTKPAERPLQSGIVISHAEASRKSKGDQINKLVRRNSDQRYSVPV